MSLDEQQQGLPMSGFKATVLGEAKVPKPHRPSEARAEKTKHIIRGIQGRSSEERAEK